MRAISPRAVWFSQVVDVFGQTSIFGWLLVFTTWRSAWLVGFVLVVVAFRWRLNEIQTCLAGFVGRNERKWGFFCSIFPQNRENVVGGGHGRACCGGGGVGNGVLDWFRVAWCLTFAQSLNEKANAMPTVPQSSQLSMAFSFQGAFTLWLSRSPNKPDKVGIGQFDSFQWFQGMFSFVVIIQPIEISLVMADDVNVEWKAAQVL